MSEQALEHEHQSRHEHHHNHDHAHTGNDTQTHSHSHSQSGEDGTDQWDGADYLKYPGLRELAQANHDTTIQSLVSAGLQTETLNDLILLEVGCGAGAVTQLFAKSFKSVHAIDVSPSMLATFSKELPSDQYPSVTHSLHTLSSSSPEAFAQGKMKSPIEGESDRVITLPRSEWNVAAVIMVLHHVDDVRGFMTGLTGLIAPGGWIVLSEFTNLGKGHKETKEGSVNAPHHHHHEFNVDSITKLLNHFGFVNVHAEVRGTFKIWRENRFHDVDCLAARGQKPSK